MNWLSPAALLWFLPLGGLIVLMYLLRMKRREMQVPATFLWPERTDEVRANAPIQRLRFNWLMVLQLLALLAAVAALAAPQLVQRGLAGNLTVIVIDASASMGATDIEPTRFDQAIQTAREMLASAGVADSAAIIEAGTVPRVVLPLTQDPSTRLDVLDSLRRSDAEVDVGEAMRLAAALLGGQEGARIVLLSDGVFEPVENFSPGEAEVVYRQIGERNENLAIAAIGTSEAPQGRQVYVGVRNYGTEPRRRGIVLLADGQEFHRDEAIADPGQTWGLTQPVPAGAQVVEARLDPGDLLAADDLGVTLVNPGSNLRVLLVGPGNLFLERALSLDARVTLDKAAEVPLGERAGLGPGTYDIIVFDGVPEVPVKAAGVLTLGAAGDPSPVVAQGSAQNPSFVTAQPDPILSGVDFGGVFIDRMEQVSPKPIGRVLVETREGPLVVAAEGTRRHLYVAFKPLDSDWPLTVGFPIFVANALTFLAGDAAQDVLAIRPGQAFAIPGAEGAEAVVRTGDTERTIPLRDGRAVIRGLDQVGTSTVTLGEETRTVYTTLRSETESDLTPKETVAMGGREARSVTDVTRFAEFWRPLALLALALLALEWWVFARRS